VVVACVLSIFLALLGGWLLVRWLGIGGHPPYVQAVGGRFVDARTGRGVSPTKLRVRLRVEGERRWSDAKPVPVARDGSFALQDLPARVVALELQAEPPEPYLRLPPVEVAFEGKESAVPLGFVGNPVLRPGMHLVIPATRGGVVRGRVAVTGGKLPASASVLALWDPGSGFETGMMLPGSPIDDTGAFRLPRVPLDRDVRVAVGGLQGSGLLSEQALARAGDANVPLGVHPGLVIQGRVLGALPDSRVIVQGPPAGRNVCMEGSAGPGVALDAGGRFRVDGLTPGTWDVLVCGKGEERPPYAILTGVRAGTRDLEVKLPRRAPLRGAVRGLPAGTEAQVEVWWAARGVRLASTTTVGGRFALDLPPGIHCSLLARQEMQEDRVAFLEDVQPSPKAQVLALASAVTLRARVDGAHGPLFAMARRGGYQVSGWVNPGDDMRFDHVPPGAYRVQLLSYAQAYIHLFAAMRGVIPQPEPWAPVEVVRAGIPGAHLKSP
jgi:hypothetical protein